MLHLEHRGPNMRDRHVAKHCAQDCRVQCPEGTVASHKDGISKIPSCSCCLLSSLWQANRNRPHQEVERHDLLFIVIHVPVDSIRLLSMFAWLVGLVCGFPVESDLCLCLIWCSRLISFEEFGPAENHGNPSRLNLTRFDPRSNLGLSIKMHFCPWDFHGFGSTQGEGAQIRPKQGLIKGLIRA